MTTLTPNPPVDTAHPAGPAGSPGSAATRWAGVAALVAAGTFVVGIALFATTLSDLATGDLDAAASVRFLVDHQAAMHVWYVVAFIVFGVALVPLVLGLRDQLREAPAPLVAAATAFGLIWTGLVLAAGMVSNVGVGVVADLAATEPDRAATVWAALDAVASGLGGGNEVAGGVWVLLVSVAGLRARALPRGLHLLGLVCAGAGLATVVPPLQPVGLVFGLGLIGWFTWIGLSLLRTERR